MFRRFLKGGKKDDPAKKEPLINSDDPEAVEISQASSSPAPPPLPSPLPSPPPSASIGVPKDAPAISGVTSENLVAKEQQSALPYEKNEDVSAGASIPSEGTTQQTANEESTLSVSQNDVATLEYGHEDESSKYPVCNELIHDLGNLARDVKDGAIAMTERISSNAASVPPSNQVADAGGSSDEIETKIPMFSGFPAIWARITAIPVLVKVGVAVAALASVAVVTGLMVPRNSVKVVPFETNLTVAFVGSSLLFVNDIPRLVEAISGEHIKQNSCLHARGSLSSILLTGNGLYYRWRTDAAILQQSLMSNGRWSTIYDLGTCTVPQLLLGYDNDITYANQNGMFYNDGNNPCIKDYMYYRYMKSLNVTDWDFVVLNEQTKRMAVSNARSASLDTLDKYYAPMLQNTSAIPVIVQPHAYWSDKSNMTGLSDVATFTSLIYEGTEEFAATLKQKLPSSQTPRVAPVGVAFLAVHEEDHDLWDKMFGSDGVHASLFGSYVIGLVLYATMHGKMPPTEYALPDSMASLWSRARKLQESGGYPSSDDYPTSDEAAFLYDVVERVTIKKYKPSTLDVSG